MIPSLSNHRVAITGGAGFVGHHLALALKQAGADVHVIDSLQVNNLSAFSANPNAVPNGRLYLDIIRRRLDLLFRSDIPLHIVDVRDYQTISPLLNEIKPTVIVHLAAVAHANVANRSPYTTFDHSLRTLENVLDSVRNKDVHFVYFSSSMVYGNFTSGFVREETPCEPLGIYGALKFAGEKIVIAYNQVFGVPYTIVRPSALYGPRCVSRRVGQIFIENALRGIELEVAGDGEEHLDFTYIDDVVEGISHIIDNPRSRNEIFNLTYGRSRSINDLIGILREKVIDLSVANKPRDKLMPHRGTLCMDKAKEVLGFVPQYPIERGFPVYIEWYKGLFESSNIQTKLD